MTGSPSATSLAFLGEQDDRQRRIWSSRRMCSPTSRILRRRCAAVARVLAPGGLFGFTVETHDGEGAIVGAKMRYAHGADFVRDAIAQAGLTLIELDARLDAHGEPRAGSGPAGGWRADDKRAAGTS